MNAEDLRAKSIDELAKLVVDLRKEKFNARFQKAQGALENTATIRKNRRDIARAKTILAEKRLTEAKNKTNTKSTSTKSKDKKTTGKKVA
ncbi:MAG: 50S ribosomal protein L29 [Alphaproteobacteria bacterium]